MNTKTKWMVTMEKDDYQFVDRLAREAKINGSVVFVEALRRAMKDPAFKTSLQEAQAKAKLSELESKKEEIEAEISDLQKKVSRSGNQ